MVHDVKTYVLDTSVLLSSPKALVSFEEHEVVIPIVVIKELESKRDHPTLGMNARSVLRSLEKLRNENNGDLRKGIIVNSHGGTVRIELNHVDSSSLPEAVRADRSNDTRILSVAAALKKEGKNVIIVSKDLPMRLIAHGALNIPAEDYLNDQATAFTYSGVVETVVSKAELDEFYRNGHSTVIPLPEAVEVNTGVILTSAEGGGGALGVVRYGNKVELIKGESEIFGMRGRSAEQRIALHHLMNPDVGIVSLGGPAGTGKSVLALAAALELVLERNEMKRIIVFRPILAVGQQDLGFLPGTEEEKMDPWGAAVYDALRAITTDDVIREVRDRGMLEILPLTHIRGRTLGPNDIVIVDEAQNLERSTILTAITRLGEGSRIFLLHDIAQRDSLRVGRYDGISTVVERLKGEALFAHIDLVKSERSPVAALAAQLLDDIYLP